MKLSQLISEAEVKCPPATQDIDLNLEKGSYRKKIK